MNFTHKSMRVDITLNKTNSSFMDKFHKYWRQGEISYFDFEADVSKYDNPQVISIIVNSRKPINFILKHHFRGDIELIRMNIAEE